MSLTKTRIACRCGTTIETAFTSELESWQTRHDKCFQPAREWVGLTDEELNACWNDLMGTDNFTREGITSAIEAKLREKNQ